MGKVVINIELQDDQAEALAQFCKRIGFSDCRNLSANNDEAYTVQDVLTTLSKALAAVGYNPR